MTDFPKLQFGDCQHYVIRTRVYLKDANQWEPASRVHGRYFGDIRPANTLLEIAALVGPYEVEIEVEAVVDPA